MLYLCQAKHNSDQSRTGMESGRLSEYIKHFSNADDSGKVAIVTGANSGIGRETTMMLAARGMHVIMACRSLKKAEAAKTLIMKDLPGASLSVLKLDLASLESVRQFAAEFNSVYNRLDLLINNGGIMISDARFTEDGFEAMLGINHLGHFALGGLLLSKILSTPLSRIISVSSIAHFKGIINFDDLMLEKSFSRKKAYRQSKLANLLYSYELDSRLKAAGKETLAIAAHPGITSTNILPLPRPVELLKELVLMKTVKGALPTMMAATDPALKGGEFIGPDGYKQTLGYPAVRKSGDHTKDKSVWTKLWKVSENLCGVEYKF